MNRELTLREKVLLLILIVLVMVLGYFKLLYEPVSDRIACCREDTAQEQLAMEQNDLPGLTALLDEGRRRKEEVDGH